MSDRFRWEKGQFTITLPRKRKAAISTDQKYSDDQPRGDDGRWSAEGGGGDVAGAVTAGAERGGFSVHPYRGSSPKTGYQVAIQGRTQHFDEAVLHDTNALTKAILEHREANKDLYRAGGKMYLGGWTHEGKLWLEPSERVGSRAEAVKLGADRNQIAIWDNAKSAEISTGGSGG